MLVNAINSSPRLAGGLVSFGRAPEEYEEPKYKSDIREGLGLLGKTLTIILPTNCSPSEADKDVGIGQPYSAGSKTLFHFLTTSGYTGRQVEPSGLGKQTDASPYVKNSSAYDTGIVDLEKLTKPENGGILSKETYKNIVENNPTRGTRRSSYKYNMQARQIALSEAYETFISKKADIDSLDETERKAIEQLDSDFQIFKEKHGKQQEKNALYSILTNMYSQDYWPNWGMKDNPSINYDDSDWDVETDKDLFTTPRDHAKKQRVDSRLNYLRETHKDEIDSFLFSQMLAKKTIDEGQKIAEKDGIKTIGDIPVAFSDAEVWGNRDLFLDDMRMGCMEPWSKEPQRWGFFVLDPNQLFNHDGSLGKAGQFLYDKYERAFEENKGGVRIDHIVGLMDPYVYNDKNHNHQGRLYSELYRGTNGDRCDRILRNIVLPAAKNAGLNASNIIAEDLGYMPGQTMQAFRDLGIGGIKVTQWMDAHDVWNAPYNDTIMVANHDTASAKELYPDKYERRNKFIELFSSGAKNVQVFWTDMFGIGERYNQPGATGDKNWSLRLTSDFKDEYYKKLEDEDALNIPEAILEANRRRNPNFSRDHHELSESLKHWANVLKEKTQ